MLYFDITNQALYALKELVFEQWFEFFFYHFSILRLEYILIENYSLFMSFRIKFSTTCL